jgi:predicted NBD/HSP70 family sugar kinase
MGVVDGQGAILCRRVFGATSVNNAERFTDTLCDHLEDLLLKRGLMPTDVRRIGIAVAGGSLMARDGDICAPEVFGGQAVPLRALVEGRVGVNPSVLGDARAAAIAELWHTRAQGDFLCVTLGRSVGVALVRGGTLQAAELAATCGAQAEGDLLPQAMTDALTKAIGSHAIAHRARLRFPHKLPAERLSARDVFTLAEQRDADALALLAESVEAFAAALLPVCAHMGVPAVVLAGALCAYQPSLVEPLNLQLAALARAGGQAEAPVARQAVCGGDAVMVGAALGMEARQG